MVLQSCGECGYDEASLTRAEIVRAVTALAADNCAVLTSVAPGRLRAHPGPGWSALEYGCHLRDVLRFQRERTQLAQVADNPAFMSMRRDERAAEERYNDQDPAVVAADLAARAGEYAATLAGLDDAGWLRTGVYPWPEPAVRTVEWIGQRARTSLRTICSTAAGYSPDWG